MRPHPMRCIDTIRVLSDSGASISVELLLSMYAWMEFNGPRAASFIINREET